MNTKEIIKQLREIAEANSVSPIICKEAASILEAQWERIVDLESKLVEDDAYRWISITDKIPENCYYVITCSSDGGVYQDFYDHEQNGFSNARWQGRTITHWMPMPEAPSKYDPKRG